MGCGCSSSSRNKSEVTEIPLLTNPNFKTQTTDRALDSQIITFQAEKYDKLQDSTQIRNEGTLNDSLRNSASKFELNLIRIEESKQAQSDSEENKKDSQQLRLVITERSGENNIRKGDPIVSNLYIEINAYLSGLYDSVI